MSTPPDKVREAFGRINEDNEYLYDWSMTPTHLQDIVKLVVPPPGVLPVIFVPGIMGTNLKSKSGQKSKAAAPVWRLDKGFMGQPTSVVSQWATKTAGRRQTVLHPDLVEVDDDGAVPTRVVGSITDISQYKSRGWGEVGQASYEEFLVWLENKLNVEQGRNNPYLWKEYTFTRFEAAGPSAGIGTAPPQTAFRNCNANAIAASGV